MKLDDGVCLWCAMQFYGAICMWYALALYVEVGFGSRGNAMITRACGTLCTPLSKLDVFVDGAWRRNVLVVHCATRFMKNACGAIWNSTVQVAVGGLRNFYGSVFLVVHVYG